MLLVGIFAVVAAIFAAPRVLRLQGKVSRYPTGPTQAAVLAQRVRLLTETRADATDTQARNCAASNAISTTAPKPALSRWE